MNAQKAQQVFQAIAAVVDEQTALCVQGVSLDVERSNRTIVNVFLAFEEEPIAMSFSGSLRSRTWAAEVSFPTAQNTKVAAEQHQTFLAIAELVKGAARSLSDYQRGTFNIHPNFAYERERTKNLISFDTFGWEEIDE